LSQDVVLDTDFLSAFLKIDRLDLIKDFFQTEVLLIPLALQEKDRYRFRKDVLDLLLS
jgi:hypothetical protein